MSKQQTFAPDDLETHRPRRSVKKTKPWVLWYRYTDFPGCDSRDLWAQRMKEWRSKGRYASQRIAADVRDHDKGKLLRWQREYRIMRDDEGKPE